MAQADFKWLAIPAILIIALGVAVYLNQPKVNEAGDVKYIDVNGDEYLSEDYVTNDELSTGDSEGELPDSEYDFPESVADCTGRAGIEKDRCLLIFSVLNESGEGCGAMSDPVLKSGCYHKTAEMNLNSNFCAFAGIEAQGCYIDIATQNNDASLCEKGHINMDQCYVAARTGDFELCPESVDRRTCNEAVSNNDPSICAQTETLDGFCYYTIATQTNNDTLCAKAKQGSNTCYFKVALAKSDIRICDFMKENRDNCVAWIAFTKGDKGLCKQAGTEAQSCVEDIEADSQGQF